MAQSPRSRQTGLTLVELMIAAALGLLLLAALGYLYVGNRQTFRTHDNVARLQENGRYAMEVLGQDLRMVGYLGCGALGEVTMNSTATGKDSMVTPAPGNVLGGSEGGSEGGTDADRLTLMRVDSRGAALTSVMANADAPVPIPASPRQHAAGTHFLIADCRNADLFRASALVEPGATSIKHEAGTYNTVAALGKPYGADALVFPFEALEYRIGTNPGGNPALYREVNGTAQEVVENVKDMQIVYGVDNNNDGAVDAYVLANEVTSTNNWARVLAVRVSLLLRSPEANVATQPQTVFWDRDNDGVSDLAATDPDLQARRLLYVFTSTIGLRNRVR